MKPTTSSFSAQDIKLLKLKNATQTWWIGIKHQNLTIKNKQMKPEIPMNKKMANLIVQVCIDVAEFSKICEQIQPNSTNNYLKCNEEVKLGLKWFINSKNQAEMLSNIEAYLQSVQTALELYMDLSASIENKDKFIFQLTNLQIHLKDLKKQILINT